MMIGVLILLFFFVKQKTAYEMRISDWSSDVCSSDLIIGAGTFADDRSAAISCTGTGESFIRVGFGSEVDAQIRYRETTLANATAHALDAVAMLGGRGGCIAIDARGKIALPFNSSAMFRAWFGEDGEIGVAVRAE